MAELKVNELIFAEKDVRLCDKERHVPRPDVKERFDTLADEAVSVLMDMVEALTVEKVTVGHWSVDRVMDVPTADENESELVVLVDALSVVNVAVGASMLPDNDMVEPVPLVKWRVVMVAEGEVRKEPMAMEVPEAALKPRLAIEAVGVVRTADRARAPPVADV